MLIKSIKFGKFWSNTFNKQYLYHMSLRLPAWIKVKSEIEHLKDRVVNCMWIKARGLLSKTQNAPHKKLTAKSILMLLFKKKLILKHIFHYLIFKWNEIKISLLVLWAWFMPASTRPVPVPQNFKRLKWLSFFKNTLYRLSCLFRKWVAIMSIKIIYNS